ncbi:HDOD domain-containing protein [Methylogaea oryzae]|uniref:HDOD domain-containing protein n=1 Tax=Methylogaea oryzae TaxID=1295382 RepID=A0A8D4VPA1_9GAMM|nr:HDOD domain-containing protein [Methylogaea oryzae]BBL70000.1 hypothetical protein MoryE10_06060 [Methylogaea oryzae]
MGSVSHDFPKTARIAIHKLRLLPPIPVELQRLLEIVRDEQTTLDQLYVAVENSPALTARLLGLANSAYFGQSGAVSTIRQAIYQVLGLNTVKSLVYTQLLSQTLDTSRCAAFQGEQFWCESLLTAIFAQRLAGQAKVDAGVAYTTGLLANLGLLALVHTFPEEMAAMFRAAEESGVRLSQQLRGELGMDQYRAGAWLASRWHFPDALCLAIMSMADGGSQAASPLASVVRLARCLAQQCYRGEDDRQAYEALAEELGLEADGLPRVLEAVKAKRLELAESARLLGNPP